MTIEEYTRKVNTLTRRIQSEKISYEEYLQKRRRLERKYRKKEFFEQLQKENWLYVTCVAIGYYEILDIVFRYFDMVPDKLKYNFAINAYVQHGDSVPAVRRAVRSLRKYKLPDNLKHQDVITIYRAGEEEPAKARFRLSWTTDKNVADFFAHSYQHAHARYIYKAKIKKDDIIAYTNNRLEHEVIQYNKIYDLEILEKL